MSLFLEFEDKTVEMAVHKACDELKLPMEKLRYDVISYGSSGIFGLVGVKKARIRVPSPEPPPKKHISENNNRHKPAKRRKKISESPLPREKMSARRIIKDTAAEEQPVSEAPRELGREALQRIVDFITTDAEISVREDTERIFFNVRGGNTGVLIGKRGQTLEAIQYLVEKIINKQHNRRVRIQVDVEGYLDNRRAKLENLAARLSEKAKRIGKPVSIGQLNAYDRRIVHIALKDDNAVRTQSMGEGFYRKLVIFPHRRYSSGRSH
ncbi:MAG: hypothetical protein B6245_00995 [Desulfobacteraceae bacterium 4572_88]|nr:MAG: hypothetical protein B6245_00995 [Desulfobacteraceae bacterium 4572_88]